MKIEVKIVRENADGSADADIFLDEEAKDLLMKNAIIMALKEATENAKQYVPKEEQ